MRFSISRSSRPPPSLVIVPPSNCARISRRFWGLNPKTNWLHSVVIRLFSFLAGFLSEQKSYAMKQQPFFIYYEKFRLAYRDLSLRPKPFKFSANGFVHRDFGSISQFTGRLGAVQVLTRRHHCNGTGRYFRSRAVQVLVLKSLPCRNQLGCGQRNLLGFGSPCNRSDLCHELLHGQILSTNKIALTRMPILTDPYKPAPSVSRIDDVPLSGDVTWKRTIGHLDDEAPRSVAGVVLAEGHRWDTDDHRHSFRRLLSGQRILCPFHLQIGVLIVRSFWVTL